MVKRWFTLAFATGAMSVAAAAAAADESGPSSGAVAVIEEVVVTARRREEGLQSQIRWKTRLWRVSSSGLRKWKAACRTIFMSS